MSASSVPELEKAPVSAIGYMLHLQRRAIVVRVSVKKTTEHQQPPTPPLKQSISVYAQKEAAGPSLVPSQPAGLITQPY